MKQKAEFDFLYYGIISGIVGGLAQNAFTRPLVWLHVIDSGVLEHAKAIMISYNGRGFIASTVGLIGHLFNAGLWGGIFALLITKYPGHKYTKGAGVGLLAWLLIMFVTTLLGKHEVGPEEPLHALILLVGGVIYGLVVAWTYRRLTRKFG